jgi:hypothetical protein
MYPTEVLLRVLRLVSSVQGSWTQLDQGDYQLVVHCFLRNRL